MPADILVIGSLNMDLVVKAERAPEAGETLHGLDFQTIPGGKGANQAAAAARLGAATAMAGRVGADEFGARLKGALANARVDTSTVLTDEAQPTGIAQITVDAAGENRILIVAGANGQVSPADVGNLRPAIEQAKILVLQLEIPLETVSAALQVAAESGIPTILNLAPARSIPDEMLQKISYLIVNESEAGLLSDLPVSELETAKTACKVLFARGAENIIVTLGAQGALLATKHDFYTLPAYRVDVVDTTAAGDAFTAGFAVALLESGDLQASVAYANAVGALTVTKFGAQASLPTKAEVDVFLRKTK